MDIYLYAHIIRNCIIWRRGPQRQENLRMQAPPAVLKRIWGLLSIGWLWWACWMIWHENSKATFPLKLRVHMSLVRTLMLVRGVSCCAQRKQPQIYKPKIRVQVPALHITVLCNLEQDTSPLWATCPHLQFGVDISLSTWVGMEPGLGWGSTHRIQCPFPKPSTLSSHLHPAWQPPFKY